MFNMANYQNNVYGRINFFEHYQRQHAIISQHFRNLIHGSHAYYSSMHNPMDTGCHEHSSCISCSSGESTSCSSCSVCSSCESYSSDSSEYELEQNYEEDGEDKEESGLTVDNEEVEEDDESEYEYELNVDAILAMRAAKEELKKDSSSESDSIVLVESDKEDFEFIDYGSLKTLESRLFQSVEGSCNKNREAATRKEIMQYLYGEKSATIAGLETAMAVHFNHICDNQQPSLWPVLPLRL